MSTRAHLRAMIVNYPVSCTQVWHYFIVYKRRDDLCMKLFVAFVWLSGTIHQGWIAHDSTLCTNCDGPYHLTNMLSICLPDASCRDAGAHESERWVSFDTHVALHLTFIWH
jgi:hypothetical protein